MRVLFVRLSSFGDVLFSFPAAKALASAPGARLAWAIEGPLAPLLTDARWVDNVFIASTRVWRRRLHLATTRSDIRRLLSEVGRFAPDVVVDAQGLFKSAWLTFLAPAARKVGFGVRAATERISCLATDERVDPVDRAHVVDRALALAEHVTGRAGFDRIPDVTHLVERPAPEVDTFLETLDRPFALLQPFSSSKAKELPDETSIEVARALAADGLTPVFRWGPGEDERARFLAGRAGEGARIGPRADPAASARLAARAAVFIGVDTGPTHLAAAAGAPTLAVFGPTDPARFGPVGPRCASLSPPRRLDAGSFLATVSPREVVRAAEALRR